MGALNSLAELLNSVILIVLAVVVVVMPFFVISINSHVKQIRKMEHFRFMMHLQHGDVTSGEINEIMNAGLITLQDVDRISRFRKQRASE